MTNSMNLGKFSRSDEDTYLVIFYKPYEWEELGAMQAIVPWQMLFATEVMGMIETKGTYKFLSPLSEYIQ